MSCRRQLRRVVLLGPWLAALVAVAASEPEQPWWPLRPLADDLPDPRWGQDPVTLLRCCKENEVFVSPADRSTIPTCQPAPASLHWQPQLLDARTNQRGPPDKRTVVLSSFVKCDDGGIYMSDDLYESGFQLLTTGQLYIPDTDALLPAGQFCFNREVYHEELNLASSGGSVANVTLATVFCRISMNQVSSLLDMDRLEPTCRRSVCYRKCCPRGHHLDLNQECVLYGGSLFSEQPIFHRDTVPVGVEHYRAVWGNADCPPSKEGRYGRVFDLRPDLTEYDRFYIQTNGSLYVPAQKQMIDMRQFCVERAIYNDSGNLFLGEYAIVCFGDVPPEVATHHRVYAGMLGVSAALLFVTFVAYAAIGELRNVHGHCLMSQVQALFTAYICRIAAQATAVYDNLIFCQAIGFIMYYSFLAVCFWLNAMSFDIWRTFSRVHVPTAAGGKTKRFCRYSLYSWLSPLAITAVAVFMQFAPESLVSTELYLRPGFGVYSCWLAGSWEQLAYLHGPLLVLMTANLVLYVMTARCLMKSEQDSQMVRKKKTAIERFKIYVNLFIVMGISWVTEALSVNIGHQWLWYLSDAINCLQGLIIFLLFTMRKRSRRIIWRHLDSWGVLRWCRCCRLPSSVDGRIRTLFSSNKTQTTSLQTGTSAPLAQPHELEPVMAAVTST